MPGCGDDLYTPGHNLHWIQTKKAGSDPLSWFPATVVEVTQEIAVVRYDDDETTCRLWRHGGFGSRLLVDDRVSVCERWHVLQLPNDHGGNWVCIEALDAAPARTTELPEHRSRPFRAVPVDMSTGEGHP
jgi:hypothetical protein